MRLIRSVNPVTIYINGIFSFWYSVLPLLITRTTGKQSVVVAPSGMLGIAALRIKRWKKRPFISFMKSFGIYRDVIWHAASPYEKKEIVKTIDPDSEIIVAPLLASGVMESSKSPAIPFKQKNHLKLCYISRINEKKNLLYALEVLREIEDFLSIEMNIFGPVDDWLTGKNVRKQSFNYRKTSG